MARLEIHRQPRETLAEHLRTPGPSLVLLHGMRGVGRTALLRELLGSHVPSGATVVRHRCAPLPGPDQRRLVARSLARDLGGDDDDGAAPASWTALLDRIADRAADVRTPLVLALDDAPHLLASDREAGRALLELWGRLRAGALPVHVVLSGRTPHLAGALDRSVPELLDATSLELELHPAEPWETAALVPEWSPRDRLRAWAVFGGGPDRLTLLDPSATLATNVRRLALEPGAPLLTAGLDILSEELQTPARYVSLLAALAGGARDWGSLARACPDFESGSRMAPYLARLEELGLVVVRRSLDAGERSRSRRYRIADPFVAFWYRFVLPRLSEVELEGAGDLWSRAVRPGVDAHVEAVLPSALRRWARVRGGELLPDRARVAGGLWGTDYDLPVSGTLVNGAPFYGTAVWSEEPVDETAFESIGTQLRRTRYGYGREARHRILFSAAGFTPSAHRAMARDAWAHGLDLATLLGDSEKS